MSEPIRTTVLDDGLTVVTERMPAVRSAAVGFWVGVGSRDEDERHAGASHFLEHLLFKGTATRSAAEIAETVDEVGGHLDAFTTREYTAFEVRLLAEHLDVGLDVLSDIFWRPAFRHDDVETERDVILEEIRGAADEPGELVHDLLIEAMFPDDPLGRPILGSTASIGALTAETIAGFHAAHYLPGDVVVAAAGAIEHDAVVEGVARRRGDGSGGARRRRPPLQSTVARRHRRERGEQVHLELGVAGLDRVDSDRFALDVAVQVLGGGLSSRLFQEVRERRGLAYEVFASHAGYDGAGVVHVYAATSPRTLGQVVDLVRAELDAIGRVGVTDRELAVAKAGIRASYLLGLEDTGARMARLGRSHLALGETLPLDEVLSRYEALTLDDVGRVVGRLFAAEPAQATVGPTR
ncbi:MAG TPA: pitrilysin family protein [Acidimicrobiales bacterium]|nr:pitrilysin family protein [Acidimicrobiales bacterium]